MDEDIYEWSTHHRGSDPVSKGVRAIARTFIRNMVHGMTRGSFKRRKKERKSVSEWIERTDCEPFSPQWIEDVLGIDVRRQLRRVLEDGHNPRQ